MKKIDLTRVLLDFEGNEIPVSEGDPSPTTLKRVLLLYCRMAGQMAGLTDAEQATLYEVGMIIGTSKEALLTQPQYDALKKMVDSGKVRGADGREAVVFGPEIRFGTKLLVDAAETVEG